MAARSSSSTQTKPGSPVQQWPQRVQVKRKPSLYQGSDITRVLNSGKIGKSRNRDDTDRRENRQSNGGFHRLPCLTFDSIPVDAAAQMAVRRVAVFPRLEVGTQG